MVGDIFSTHDNFTKWTHVKSILLRGNYTECQKPLVSVIIPCYNRPQTLKIAILSAINQDCDFEYEIIIVDNYNKGEQSPNYEIVKSFVNKNIFYYRNQQNIGMVGNWNRGIELSRSENITFCHDDDILLPDCLRRLMVYRKKYSKECILSAWNIINDNGDYLLKKDVLLRKKRMKFLIEKEYYRYSLYDQFLSSKGFGCGCLFRKDILLQLGGYSAEFYPSSDYALHCKYTYYYGCIYTNLPTFNYRIGNNNESNIVYSLFNEADRHFRDCMIDKILLPSFFLRLLNEALFRIKGVQMSLKYNNKNILTNLPTKKDYLILKIASFYSHKIKPYRISLKKQ